MGTQIAGIVAGAVDERRFAPAQELNTHQVHTGGFDDTAVVAHAALAVQDRHVQVRIVRAEAGRP